LNKITHKCDIKKIMNKKVEERVQGILKTQVECKQDKVLVFKVRNTNDKCLSCCFCELLGLSDAIWRDDNYKELGNAQFFICGTPETNYALKHILHDEYLYLDNGKLILKHGYSYDNRDGYINGIDTKTLQMHEIEMDYVFTAKLMSYYRHIWT